MKRHTCLIIITTMAILAMSALTFVGCASSSYEKEASFSIAILPDTQLYCQYDRGIFKQQTEWIAANAKSHDIKFVIHLGDIVNRIFDLKQWNIADEAMKVLDDAGIPYLTVSGNHDVDYLGGFTEMNSYNDGIRSGTENYLKYFGHDRFEGMNTFRESTKNGFNQFHILKVGTYELLVIGLDWIPSQETMQWCERVLKKHSDIPTIIVKHEFIKPRGIGSNEAGYLKFSSLETEKQWDVFSEFDQVFMIINGHHSGQDHVVVKNKSGHDVLATVIDYQNLPSGGDGWMNILNLDPESGTLSMEAFSPYLSSWDENSIVELNHWTEMEYEMKMDIRRDEK